MRRKRAIKAAALLMSASLLIGSLPTISGLGMGRKVSAAEEEMSGFATKEQLLADYSLSGAAGQKVQKVRFGLNGKGDVQSWYVAGKDPATKDGLVLFAATPLKEQQFQIFPRPKVYEAKWGCEYETDPSMVNGNHYGGSEIRAALKAMSSDPSYFSASEQKLMRETAVMTGDQRNGGLYTTKDKLYLAQGEPDSGTIQLGTIKKSDVKHGLPLKLKLYNTENNDKWFWLRTPYAVQGLSESLLTARSAGVSAAVADTEGTAIVPALQIDLSSVIFASTASSEKGQETQRKELTLRYDAGKSLGSATVLNHETVKVKGSAEDRYLVVQNKYGTWRKKATKETTVPAEYVTIKGEELTSFKDCKVWIEKTSEDRLTRATEAEEKASVTFKDYNGKVLETQEVNYGEKANAPKTPTREGYTFTGWDKNFNKITGNVTITAQYRKNPEPTQPKQPTIRPGINLTKKEILSGKSLKLSVKNRDKGAVVSYKTSNKKIAAVNQNGTIKGVAAGRATITTIVRQGGKTYTFKTSVTVKGYLKLTKVKKTIKKGKSYKFKAKAYGIKGKFHWTVSNKKIGSISKSGKFKAKKKGKVYVIVKNGKYKAKFRVRVK